MRPEAASRNLPGKCFLAALDHASMGMNVGNFPLLVKPSKHTFLKVSLTCLFSAHYGNRILMRSIFLVVGELPSHSLPRHDTNTRHQERS